MGGTGLKTIGAATVNTALTLGGVLTTGSTALTLAPGATVAENDASYVLGQVQTTHTVGTSTDNFGGLGLTLTPTVAPGPTTVLRTTGQPLGTGSNVSIGRYYDLTTATSRSLRGTTLALSYLPHKLNGVPEAQLTLFRSVTAGATWSNESATLRNPTAQLVSRDFVTELTGRWTLASATAPPTPAALTYAITALPVPFTADGLSLQVTTPTAGPLTAQLYDVLGRTIYNHAVATVAIGTSTVVLPNSGILLPGKYDLLVQQAGQEARIRADSTFVYVLAARTLTWELL